MNLELVLELGGIQEAYPIGDEMAIGRSNANHLRLDHFAVAMEHCRIVRRRDRLFLEDFQCRESTRVSGRPVDGWSELRDGDVLEVGPYRFGIREDHGELAPVALPPTPPPPTDRECTRDLTQRGNRRTSGSNARDDFDDDDLLTPAPVDFRPARSSLRAVGPLAVAAAAEPERLPSIEIVDGPKPSARGLDATAFHELVSISDSSVLALVGNLKVLRRRDETLQSVRDRVVAAASTGAGPGAVLGAVNALLYEKKITATAVCALIDTQDRQIRYAHAGHPTPWIVGGASCARAADRISPVSLGKQPHLRLDDRSLELGVGESAVLVSGRLIDVLGKGLQTAGLEAFNRATSKRPGSTETIGDRLRAAYLDAVNALVPPPGACAVCLSFD